MTENQAIEQLTIHIEEMGWETKDCDYHARKILDILDKGLFLMPEKKIPDDWSYTKNSL